MAAPGIVDVNVSAKRKAEKRPRQVAELDDDDKPAGVQDHIYVKKHFFTKVHN